MIEYVRRVGSALGAGQPDDARTPLTRFDLRHLAIVYVVWRVSHAAIVAMVAGDPFAPTLMWDAGFYLSIANDGYEVTDPTWSTFQNVNFWPALPFLARPFIALFGESWGTGILSNLLSVAAFGSVWLATRAWFGQRVADRTVVFLAVWPGSMFLWAFLSEGLFVTATAVAFWADRRDRPVVAVVCVFVAGLTRSVGVVFGPVFVVMRAWRRWGVDRVVVGYLVAWVLSLASVLLIFDRSTGHPFAPFRSQAAWGRGLSAPWVPLADAIDHIIDKAPGFALETSMNVVVTLLFLGVAGAAVVAALRHVQRGEAPDLPLAPSLWALVATTTPQFTGLITSMLRYVLGAWPGFVLAAVFTRDRPRLRAAALGGQAVLSVVLVVRYGRGIWVS